MAEVESKKDAIMEYTLLGFLIVLVGWLAYKYTGNEANQISPQFYVGFAIPLIGQLIRKTFDLKKSA
jgi:hypothetical protein